MKTTRPLLTVAVLMSFSLFVFAGCSSQQEQSDNFSDAGPRMGGPGGSRSEPVAANATAPQIFQQKCQGCHGDKGQGDKGPALTKIATRSNAELQQIIHDGHEKMPAFANQMTKAQIEAVVTYIKKLNSKS